ncbi:hypothetical protein BCR42DRAFT_451847 [Absidia repens]|uniref:Chromo domain-containing protein n=1 Tax=Absidia repens TaxID=90262 RepID=A0A1X2IGC4_9FUNG|nr:hypothetical protein BCR42DRAFT_451847 [Absidia repens]
MARSPLKKKRTHGNASSSKTTYPHVHSSSSINTLADINHNQDDTTYSDSDIENFCDMDDYSDTITKNDRSIFSKRTFIDIDSLENDSEDEVNNNYELIDTDDDLFHQLPFSDTDNDTSKHNDKKKDSKKKGKTPVSPSLLPCSPSLPQNPELFKGSTANGKRRLEDSDDNDDNDDNNKNKTTNTSSGSNKKHTQHEATPPPAAINIDDDDDDNHLPSIQESMLEDDIEATLRRRESLDNRWDPGSKYEVESILQHKTYRNHVVRYEVKWKGYPDSENTLEPAASFHEDCRQFVLQYWRSLPKDVVRPTNIPMDPTWISIDDDNENDNAASLSLSTVTKSPMAATAVGGADEMIKHAFPTEVISLDDDDDTDYLDAMEMNDDDDPISRTLSSDDDMAFVSDHNNNSSSNSSSNSDSDNRTELGLGNGTTPTSTAPYVAAETSTNGHSNNTKTIHQTIYPLIPIINDDAYKLIAKTKKITQKDMATNYKKDGYKFIYSKPAGQILDEMDWTDEDMTIDNILPLKTDQSQLMAYLTWPNHVKTVHLIEELHDKCAKKLCLYYEKQIQHAHSS